MMCHRLFFFKQKTAYEMRISDWSSDVCSSDLDSIDIPSGNAGPADAANGPAAPATDVSPANGEFDYNRISGVEGNPNVTPEFINEVEAMAARLGTKPEYLMAVMSFETGGSFSPAQANRSEEHTSEIQSLIT